MRRRLIAAAVLIAAGVAGVLPAVADVAQPTVVTANPVDFTPHALDGTVRAIAVVGNTVVVGGTFSSVVNEGRSQAFAVRRPYLFAFDAKTGAVRTNFAPTVDGAVYALAAGPDNSVYVGGAFRNVNGAAARGLTRLSVSNGARVRPFTAQINWGDVRTLALHGKRLYAGGPFSAINGVARAGLARLDGVSGAVDTGFDAKLAAKNMARVRVEDMALSPDGRRLVAIGAITHAGGQPRNQLAMLDVSGPKAALSTWYTDSFVQNCDTSLDTYLRGVDFSPDGKYFVIVTTGALTGPGKMCDSASRFESAGAGRHGRQLGQPHGRQHAVLGVGDRQRGLRRRPPAVARQPARQEEQGPGRRRPPRHRRHPPENRQGPTVEPHPQPRHRRPRHRRHDLGFVRRLRHRQTRQGVPRPNRDVPAAVVLQRQERPRPGTGRGRFIAREKRLRPRSRTLSRVRGGPDRRSRRGPLAPLRCRVRDAPTPPDPSWIGGRWPTRTRTLRRVANLTANRAGTAPLGGLAWPSAGVPCVKRPRSGPAEQGLQVGGLVVQHFRITAARRSRRQARPRPPRAGWRGSLRPDLGNLLSLEAQ